MIHPRLEHRHYIDPGFTVPSSEHVFFHKPTEHSQHKNQDSQAKRLNMNISSLQKESSVSEEQFAQEKEWGN